jgi:uroporphyrinogen-III decarboxylase
MAQTPREVVYRTLSFEGPERMARQTWILPWVEDRFGPAMAELQRRYPDDIIGAVSVSRPSSRAKGNPFAAGTSVDEWGCVFESIAAGMIGEVKTPVMPDLDDLEACRPPYETLPEDLSAARDTVKVFCEGTDRFVMAGACPRPWERLQFLRGTENAMIDVMAPEDGVKNLLKKIHDFHLRELEFWVTTPVDTLFFMDDWGSQKQLLIPPRIWRELFKPLYKDYCDIAHAHGKFIFMHSDGYISEIYDDLMEIGVDALNSQLFTMDLGDLARRAKGKITFWGEIDRQHVLPAKDPAVARNAVRTAAKHLYDPRGGMIAQFELGPGANPENAFAIYDEWDRVFAQS